MDTVIENDCGAMATWSTGTGIPTTVRSTWVTTTVTTAIRTTVRVRNFCRKPDSYWVGFCVMYFNHPFVCFEVSMSSPSIFRYVFWSMIFSSCSVRTRCFKTSSDVRARSSTACFCVLGDSDALMMSRSVESAILSISL